MNKNAWDDDVIKGVDWIKKFLDFVLKERSQLYGTIIHLMLELGKNEIPMPDIEQFKGYGEKYYVLFWEENKGEFKIMLKEREEVKETKDELLD